MSHKSLHYERTQRSEVLQPFNVIGVHTFFCHNSSFDPVKSYETKLKNLETEFKDFRTKFDTLSKRYNTTTQKGDETKRGLSDLTKLVTNLENKNDLHSLSYLVYALKKSNAHRFQNF